ncbi:MAG TPA: S41 family peptidase, partial [Gemmataceae bacterium]|nr:S41 family peptidase [Gemmataceae bacterium]
MTKAIFKGLFVFVALAGFMANQAHAAADGKGTTYAVIVGIDEYKDAQIFPRKHAEADAKLLFDIISDPQHFDVQPDQVRLLLGKEDAKRKSQAATKENILSALNWLVKSATKDDLVLFVYVGQGGAVGERTCYFTADSSVKDRAKTALNAGDIENVLDKLKCQHFCAFVDVNFKGFDPGKEAATDPDLTKFHRELLGKDDEAASTDSRVIFLPNFGTKPSQDTGDHGIFSKVIAHGLQGKADSFGYEPDGVITVDELIAYVKKALPEMARANGKTDDEKSQQPLILEAHVSDFTLDKNPAVAATAKKRLEEFDKIAKANKLPKQVVDDGHNYLGRMPKLKAQQEMRKTYQKLADGKINAEDFAKEREAVLASTKLAAEPAAEYARHVIKAADTVILFHFKKTSRAELIEEAIKGMYKKLDEPLPANLKEKLGKIKDLDRDGLETLLIDARQHLGKREDLADGKDVTMSLNPMMSKLDRHSGFIDPDAVKVFRDQLKGQFSGVGVQIRKNGARDELQVITPIHGSPAYNAKIYAGDIITHIIRDVDSSGKPLPKQEVIPTKGMTTEEAVKKITGTKGTPVKLLIEREGEPKPLEFNLIRGSVELETVLGHKRTDDDKWDFVIDPENQICYVRLSGFQENTARDLEKLMRQLYKAGIKGFILDLRFNPGGLLDQAVKICDLFIDDGMIVTIKPREGPETSYMGKSEGSYTTFPMVCLVNGYSASASEIVAACLQDHGRAIIVGSRSYGKGSVQRIVPFDVLGKEANIKVTIATFWRPSGRNLNKPSTSGKDEDDWGVIPDKGYDMPLSVKELNDLQDHQRDREIIHRPGKAAPA